MNPDGARDHDDADPLRGRDAEEAAAIVAPQELEQESNDRVEREERREDLAVVALARVDDEQADGRDRERRRGLVNLCRMHIKAPRVPAREEVLFRLRLAR